MIGIEVYEKDLRASFNSALGGPQSEWRFRVRARNGEIVAQSEGYTTKAAAETGIRALRRALLPGTRDAETLAKAWDEGADLTNGYEKEYTAEELRELNPYREEIP